MPGGPWASSSIGAGRTGHCAGQHQPVAETEKKQRDLFPTWNVASLPSLCAQPEATRVPEEGLLLRPSAGSLLGRGSGSLGRLAPSDTGNEPRTGALLICQEFVFITKYSANHRKNRWACAGNKANSGPPPAPRRDRTPCAAFLHLSVCPSVRLSVCPSSVDTAVALARRTEGPVSVAFCSVASSLRCSTFSRWADRTPPLSVRVLPPFPPALHVGSPHAWPPLHRCPRPQCHHTAAWLPPGWATPRHPHTQRGYRPAGPHPVIRTYSGTAQSPRILPTRTPWLRPSPGGDADHGLIMGCPRA